MSTTESLAIPVLAVAAVLRLAAFIRAEGLLRPDLRTSAGRRVKAEAQRLAEPLNVHWAELLADAVNTLREDRS